MHPPRGQCDQHRLRIGLRTEKAAMTPQKVAVEPVMNEGIYW
jgi:hypothetical protein